MDDDFSDDDFDIEDAALFGGFVGMVEEEEEEERRRRRLERELESHEMEDDYEDYEYRSRRPRSCSLFRPRSAKRPFEQWVDDICHGRKTIDDPLYGPPKPSRDKRRPFPSYGETIIHGISVRNAHLVSENFMHFIQIALTISPEHELNSIIFDPDGNPVVNGREEFGTFERKSRSITINLRHHFENAVRLVEHGHTRFSMRAIIWGSMVHVFLHELQHALHTAKAPEFTYETREEEEAFADAWAKEAMTALSRTGYIELPKPTEDPYFGPRIIKYLNRVLSEKHLAWALRQKKMLVDGVYYRNDEAGIEISTMKEFYDLSCHGLEHEGIGRRLNECVKNEQELEKESWEKEELCETALKDAISNGYRVRIEHIESEGQRRSHTVLPKKLYKKSAFLWVEAFCEQTRQLYQFRIDRIENIVFEP